MPQNLLRVNPKSVMHMQLQRLDNPPLIDLEPLSPPLLPALTLTSHTSLLSVPWPDQPQIFPLTVPSDCNDLPLNIHDVYSLNSFKSLLRCYLLNEVFLIDHILLLHP